jgi:glycosyltransferase involved in cell wall biosynthesis
MKIILFANTDWFLYNFRLASAQELAKQGHSVVLLSPAGSYAQNFQGLGLRWIELPLKRQGVNLFDEWITFWRLVRVYLAENPDLVHHFTVKCVLYGTLAARLAKIPAIVNSLTGLGYAFTGQRSLLRSLVSLAYGLILRSTWTIFENPDDQASFLAKSWILAKKSFVIPGAGVNLQQFFPVSEPKSVPIVTLPARLLWDKGLGEFVEAARRLRQSGYSAIFRVVGEGDPGNPTNIPESVLNDWKAENVVEWQGWRNDMAAVYAEANLICLPSYREGLPKTLVEAAAAGRAIVTTDVPGCRHVVKDGENGFLVPARDAVSLAQKIGLLLINRALREEMGAQARCIAEKEFSNEKIIAATLAVYAQAWQGII